MSNWIALQLDRKKLAQMSCIAGIGGGVKPIIKKAKQNNRTIIIDGCPLHCALACFKKEKMTPTIHFDLSIMKVKKIQHQDFSQRQARKILNQIIDDLKNKSFITESIIDSMRISTNLYSKNKNRIIS